MKIRLMIALLSITWVGQAFAHAVVTEDSLKTTPIHAHQATQVELSFNSKIERGLSQIFLVSKGDKHTLLTIAEGHKQGQILINVPSLEPGDYALRLKVFAADGHLTEDVLHFTVAK
ncbi:copper resistance CopC family protein [Methylovulum miyakonense]|uniref:copper resistance CopC family protein n=1 Tax=Methylovulum miyakonense TaxID=645578 RepID=UPI000490774B|nr:copper resistance CopC family protein [Methylovulum miyakonense]